MREHADTVALVTVCQAFVNVNESYLLSAKMLILKISHTTE
jgi:hypothetical protein